MAPKSAGILLYKYIDNTLFVMLAHPGGPFWAKKDEGSWSIPKGLFEENEEPKDAALREFKEETGFAIENELLELGSIKQPSRKIIYAWAVNQDLNVEKIKSNTFELEWPKGSGNKKAYPEIDKCQWFGIADAKRKILKGQSPFIDILMEKIDYTPTIEELKIDEPPEQGSLF